MSIRRRSRQRFAQIVNALSLAAADRVLSIRSVISVQPTSTSKAPPGQHGGYFPDAAPAKHSSMSISEPPHQFRPARHRKASSSVWNRAIEVNLRISSTGPERDFDSSFGPKPAWWQPPDVPTAMFVSKSDDACSMGAVSTESSDANASTCSPPTRSSLDETRPLVTSRFKHVVTEGRHAIITGRDGEALQRCEDEPIHVPGAVQGFGVLVALEEQQDSKLLVRVCK
jgi:hypothetical protein